MFKYISQINGGMIMFLGKILDVSWLDCEQYRKNKCKKKEHKQHSSLFEVLR